VQLESVEFRTAECRCDCTVSLKTFCEAVVLYFIYYHNTFLKDWR